VIVEFLFPGTDEKRQVEVDLTLEGLAKDILGRSTDNHFSVEFNHDSSVKDLSYIKNVTDHYFPHIIDILNHNLGVNLKLRVWKVLVGHWYFSFAKALFFRVMIVEKLADDPNLLSAEIIRQPNRALSALSSSDITDQCMDYFWNEEIFAEICLATNLIPKEKLSFSKSVLSETPNNHAFAEIKRSPLTRFIKKVTSFYVPFKWTRSRPIFYYTGMSHWEHVKLFLLSGGMPVWTKEQINFAADQDKLRRQMLADSLKNKYLDSECFTSNFELALQNLFFKCLPRNFLEAFQQNFLLSGSKVYPQKPKYIFMANGFWIDSLSFFVAKQISSGIPYLVGQHGANFGVSKIEMNFPVEEETADIFFTWGHKNSSCIKTVPCFNWKKPLLSKTLSTSKKIVIITRPPFPSKEHYSISAWYKGYINDVVSLVNSLDDGLLENIILRIHPGGAPSLEKIVWKNFLPNIEIDDANIFDPGIIGDGGILVFTYLSTLFYEVLSSTQSMKIVGVWSDIKHDVKDEHINTFAALHSANLLFDSFTDAGNYISENFSKPFDTSNTLRAEAVANFNSMLNKSFGSSSPAVELLAQLDSSLKIIDKET